MSIEEQLHFEKVRNKYLTDSLDRLHTQVAELQVHVDALIDMNRSLNPFVIRPAERNMN